MSTINEENVKTLRKSMDVNCGIQKAADYTIREITATNSYVGKMAKHQLYMDLAGDGFLNDGSAAPLPYDPDTQDASGIAGIIGKGIAGANGRLPSSVKLRIYLQGSGSISGRKVTIHYADKAPFLSPPSRTQVLSVSGTSLTYYIYNWVPGKRVRILDITAGEGISFENDDIVSCSVNLRGVETKLDNPELQMSEIEIKALLGQRSISDFEGVPIYSSIWYQAGYDDEASLLRRFYTNAPVQHEDGVITITGYDATYKLDRDFPGWFYGATHGNSLFRYWQSVMDVVKYGLGDYAGGDEKEPSTNYDWQFTGIWVDKKSCRSIIADAVNTARMDGFSSGGNYYEDFYVNYVDAGCPKLTFDEIKNMFQIDGGQISDLKIEVEEKVVKVKAECFYAKPNCKSVDIEPYEEMPDIDSDEISWLEIGQQYMSQTERYTFFPADPVIPTYSLDADVTYGVIPNEGYNHRIYREEPYDEEHIQRAVSITPYMITTPVYSGSFLYFSDYPWTIQAVPLLLTSYGEMNASITGEGKTVSLPDRKSHVVPIWPGSLATGQKLLQRSNVVLTFRFRGDPRMQPRDRIILKGIPERYNITDGQIATIESVSLEHSGGGLVSTVVARKGEV